MESRRGAGRPAVPTKTIRVVESLPQVLQKGQKWLVSSQNFGSTSPARRGFKTCKKNMARRPTTTYILNMARRPTTTYIYIPNILSIRQEAQVLSLLFTTDLFISSVSKLGLCVCFGSAILNNNGINVVHV